MEIASKYQQHAVLSQTVLGEVARLTVPKDSVIHKIWCHILPNPDPGTDFEIDAEVQLLRDGTILCRLPAFVTNSPTGIYANLFGANTGGTIVAENSIAVAYPGDATSYVLFCRTAIATADCAKLFITTARNKTTGAQLAGLKFFFAVDSASLPF